MKGASMYVANFTAHLPVFLSRIVILSKRHLLPIIVIQSAIKRLLLLPQLAPLQSMYESHLHQLYYHLKFETQMTRAKPGTPDLVCTFGIDLKSCCKLGMALNIIATKPFCFEIRLLFLSFFLKQSSTWLNFVGLNWNLALRSKTSQSVCCVCKAIPC